MRVAADIFTVVAVTAGAFFFMAGTVGLLRFPDPLTRLHALTKATMALAGRGTASTTHLGSLRRLAAIRLAYDASRSLGNCPAGGSLPRPSAANAPPPHDGGCQRCMNVPARYCTGYLGDIRVPRDPAPMDFRAWFEVYLGGRWCTFDARHNQPRIGRILMARGRDATDVAIVTSFGPCNLASVKVFTEEVA